jgi:hypothetical protein
LCSLAGVLFFIGRHPSELLHYKNYLGLHFMRQVTTVAARRPHSNSWIFAVCLALAPCHLLAASEPWQNLFDGKTLSDWQQIGGTAEFVVDNGEIVGTSKADTPNSFLTTKRPYSDFILEFDVKVDEGLNSGVQFRSNSRKDYMDGRVHGYQVEIDTSARAYSGGIYDEARRAWMYPLSRNEAGRKAFRNGEWNHYRVEAVGARISTWINGIQTARLIDNLEPSGFIALQVHSVETPEQINRKVRWRNLRIATTALVENSLRIPLMWTKSAF